MSKFRKWTHRVGDEYVVIVTNAVTTGDGFGFVHYVSPHKFLTRPAAQRHGFTLGRSDDFNIGVLRGGDLVAVLWMDEVVDDDPSAIAERAEAVRIHLS